MNYTMARLTQKQETFCIKYFELGNASEAAKLAKYSPKTAYAIGAENLLKPQIQARIDELRKKVEDDAISTEKERRKILTQIQRATIADFVDEYGNLDIKNKAQLQTSAVQEIKTERTLTGLRTTLKLRDPIGAITEHNKMDKIYSEGVIYNDIKVLIVREKPREIDAV